MRREPGELKHLSTPRKGKQNCDSPSSGERKGKSLNRYGGKAWWRCHNGVVGVSGAITRSLKELQIRCIAEAAWKAAPQWVTAP